MKFDRRTDRSEFRGPALDLWLDSVARRSRLDALVLADERGLLVAASGSHYDAERLAAESAIAAAERAPERYVRAVELDGDRVYLTAVGSQGDPEPGVATAWEGVRRILRQPANLTER